ncbi:MAG: M20/M25/M40 family metallo-hydrolase [Anaerolineaceae bacterium]|nr:M20/M25/M40 family metallo-hydrolase [Anaerolineaceae bacterium]
MTETFNDQAIDLLTKLVSIPSPSQHERKAATYLAGWLNAHGLKAYVDEVGNAVGIKGSGDRELLLLGHIDTFPGEVPIRREGDLLYGRGSVDAKGPLCTFAAAAALVDVPAGWRVTVVGAVEEEYATSLGARHILQQRLSGTEVQGSKDTEWQSDNVAELQGHKNNAQNLPIASSPHLPPPIYCVIGEPSNWDRVTLGYKGRLLMDVALTVPFSHSAGEGRLPAEQAVDLWRQIEEYCRQLNDSREADSPFTRLDPSLRHIASRDDGLFGQVDLSFGFRLPVGLSPAELEADLRRHLDALPDGTQAEVAFSGAELAYKGDKSNPLVRAFLSSIRAADGTPRFVVKTGTADMNVVGPHWPDTPLVAYGPGDSSLDHTPDEHIDVTEYITAIEVLVGVLQRVMK